MRWDEDVNDKVLW